MRRIALLIAVAAVLAVVTTGGCGGMRCADPEPRCADPVFEAVGKVQNASAAQTANTEKSAVERVDIDRIAVNPWVIAGVFLLIQWFEIWYFNRTGRKSATIDAAEAAMAPKLGIVQLGLYRLWRWCYFWKHKDKRDPDKEEEEKK